MFLIYYRSHNHVFNDNSIEIARYNTPAEAINKADEGSGVMILADGYPEKTTLTDSVENLTSMQILSLHRCYYVPVSP